METASCNACYIWVYVEHEITKNCEKIIQEDIAYAAKRQ